jgi:hypothetical protein
LKSKKTKSCMKFAPSVQEDESVLSYKWVLKRSALENPDRIGNITVTLPSGVSAKFLRSGDWRSAN